MADQPKSPLQEIIQPFIDLVRAPRALWGINLAYLIEGLVYFGILGYLTIYFNDYIGLNDTHAGYMVGVLTAGITIAMFFLGGIADKFGVRFALIGAFVLMIIGRLLLSAGPVLEPAHVDIAPDEAGRNDPIYVFTDLERPPTPVDQPVDHEKTTATAPQATQPDKPNTNTATQPDDEPSPGFGSLAHILAMLGIVLVVIGYGMYQPGAYAAVRKFTSAKTAPMAFAMLYALMNLGGWIPSIAFVLRNNEADFKYFTLPGAGVGMLGVIWVYTALTVVALIATWVLLSRKTVDTAITTAEAERAREKAASADQPRESEPQPTAPPASRSGFLNYLANHPLADLKFTFFIFALIPVQTLFAHNWLTLPVYVNRAFEATWPGISDNFELAVNFNPLLIFIFVPIVTALTQKANVYTMMIIGTAVMALPTFLLAIGPFPSTLLSFLIVMTIGEAMWQPRFLQYAAEIAPEGRTGAYMGVAQLPWFLTKMVVPLYSGWFLANYVPEEGAQASEQMWLIYASIACTSTILLILAKGWVGKDFRTTAA